MGWVAALMLLSSLSLVWGLLRLWRRRLNTVAFPTPPTAPLLRDPMEAALSRGRSPGLGALRLPLPPGLRPEDVEWSIALWPDPLLDLCVLRDHTAAALVLFDPSELAVELSNPRSRALSELSDFGQQLKLEQGKAIAYLWMFSDLPPTAFDLLCTVAAAVHLRRDRERLGSEVSREGPSPDARVPVVSWTVGGWLFGALPPFGEALRFANTVRFSAEGALRLPGSDEDSNGGMRLGPQALSVELDPTRCHLRPDGRLVLEGRSEAGELQVIVERLDGRAEVLGALLS